VALIIIALTPAVIALVLVRRRGWRTDRWSRRERRWRTWLALGSGVAFAVVGFYVVVIGAWLLGPDCGVEPSTGVRARIAMFGLAVTISLTTIPVVLAGRRRLAILAAVCPALVPLVTTFASTTSNQTGWCLF
jgi:hypothetical protein